jgi:hypothetical protein
LIDTKNHERKIMYTEIEETDTIMDLERVYGIELDENFNIGDIGATDTLELRRGIEAQLEKQLAKRRAREVRRYYAWYESWQNSKNHDSYLDENQRWRTELGLTEKDDAEYRERREREFNETTGESPNLLLPHIIRTQKAQLAAARQRNTDVWGRYEAARKTLHEQIAELTRNWEAANAELVNEQACAAGELSAADKDLRASLVKHFEQTGEKTFDKQLSVRVSTKLQYEEAAALDWCKANASIAIKESVDREIFESIAKTKELDFVKEISSPTAVIAKDLGEGREAVASEVKSA